MSCLIALIVTLIGMHSLAMPAHTQMPTATTTSISVSNDAVTSAADLTPMGMGTVVQQAVIPASVFPHDLGGMAMAMDCAMALLALVLVFLFGRSRVIVNTVTTSTSRVSAGWQNTVKHVCPPSLIALSISRT